MALLGDHAVVIGGSLAGLLTARVLSEFFARVTVLERDEIADSPAIHRSIPQGNHFHGLLQGGQQVLAALYPGFTEELGALGGVRLWMGRDAVWYLPDGKAYNFTGSVREPRDLGFEGYSASRGLFEYLIRHRTQALPNVELKTGIVVHALAHRDGRVWGVHCRDARSVAAELVVDAGGRGSQAPSWLEAMGFVRPAETTIGVDTAYSSAYFRRPASYAGEAAIFIVGPPPHFLKRGYVATVENERLLVSLIGRFVHPPTDEPGFLAFAHSLHSPFLYELIQQTERLTTIAHHRFPSSVQRHYERMPAFPEGFLVLGDALCCFNPVYGQGMSAAALQAKVLHEVLAERSAWSRELAGIAAEFFPRAADINRAPWVLAANLDFAYPQTRGERPGGMEQQGRYLAALDQLQVEDVEVQRLVMEVFQLTRPLAALQEEPLRSRVLARLEG
jgi:2-polyprenyl-6-methoxyphenol hydroxylase-like FAD-dependent oxidoreductase